MISGSHPKRYCRVWLLLCCQLASVLSNYCKLYDQFVESKQKHEEDLSKEDLDQEAKKAAQDALEKLEIPDLRLGRAILENCKSCAEQGISKNQFQASLSSWTGNVREEMRKEENFFGNMFRMIKHEDEIVSGMACQVIAIFLILNFRFLFLLILPSSRPFFYFLLTPFLPKLMIF